MLLNESGIRLPKDTQSVKIITHEDMDGFFSGLLIMNQLVKQGIPKERINVKFVQYGDDDILDKAARKNKHQALISCDFSAFPKIEMESAYNGMAKSLDVENNKYVYPGFGADYKAFKKAHINEAPSFKTLSDWLKAKCPNCLFFTKPKDSTVRRNYDDFMKGWKNYKGEDEVVMSDMDYTSDHHGNSKGNLVPGKSGQIGKEEYKSDTEHLAAVSAQDLMGWDDIEIVSRIDSAEYKDFNDVLNMPGKFKGMNRKERLGIVCAALVNQIVKKSPRLAEQLMKQSNPGLISVYNNALKILKLHENELKILNELTKRENADFDEIERLSAGLPAHEKKKILQQGREKLERITPIEALRDKTQKDLAKETDIKTTDFTFDGNVAIQNENKTYPNRYMFAFLARNGKKFAFTVRPMGGLGMVQVSATPFLTPSDKDKIDLEPICLRALDAAKEKGLVNNAAYDVIKKASGGHKTIYQLSNLGIIGNTALPPNERYEAKYYRDYEARRKALKNAAVKKALNKGYGKKLDAFDDVKKERKQDVIAFLVKYITDEVNRVYGDIKPLESTKFEVK